MLSLYFRVLSEWFPTMIATCVLWIFITAVAFVALRAWVQFRRQSQLPHLRTPHKDKSLPLVVGLFHPYCNAGGGGERVLWVAIRALQNKYENLQCVVYTGDIDATGPEIMQRVRERFGMVLPRPVEFVFLSRRGWVEASAYPHLTMLGQSLGSMVLGWEALMKFVPDVYIDTMGYAFTLPLFRYIGGCQVAAYVHYPTISTDMLEKVSQRSEGHNNDQRISRSPILSQAKLLYYRLFAYLYGVAGKRCDVIMVNSSWTRDHILGLWKAPDRTHVVYPPCDTKEFLQLAIDPDERPTSHSMLSVAQFRPEKDHPLQLRAFSHFLGDVPEMERSNYRLILAGGCRHEEDRARVEALRKLTSDLSLDDNVDFRLNVSFAELKKLMSISTIGLHTMWNEHFGIGVVELMAAGTIVIAHNSGGPRMDIVTPHQGGATGFLADTVESYAAAMHRVVTMTPQEQADIRTNARCSVHRFSEQEFEHGFLDAIQPLIPS